MKHIEEYGMHILILSNDEYLKMRNKIEAVYFGYSKEQEALLSMPLEELKISAKVRSILKNQGFNTVADLLRRNKTDLLKIPYLGHTALCRLIDVIGELGFELGSTL